MSEAELVNALVLLMVAGSALRKLTSSGSLAGSHVGLTTLSGAHAKDLFVVRSQVFKISMFRF